ncbi:MAG: signal transduction histidine kinase/DNA-binding response OmpR family regulator [Cryomorphaceae bacterium]|jgi:signal transduction histidine kinase/DNA-binding response OmpR family regulator
MIQYILFVVFLLAGAGIGYAIFRSKFQSWNQRLLAYIDGLAANDNSVQEGIPNEFQAISEKLDKLIRREDTAVEKALVNSPEASEKSKKQLSDLLIINELGQRITSSLVLKDTFDQMYSTLNSMMDAAVIELGVYDEHMETWTIYSSLKAEAKSDYTNHVSEWVKSNDREVFLNNAEDDFGRYVNEPLHMQNGEMAQSIMAFPIHFHQRVSGTITVASFRKDAFAEYHRNSITQLLGFLSVALQNAFTHEQVNLLKIRAEQSEKHEQQFLANMSHEIRTPMNAVLGMTNLLLDTKLEEKQVKYLSAISTSSKNLLVIINDILDLSKLEAGKMEIEKIPFRIRDVMENVQDTSRYKSEEKGLVFEVNLSPDIPDVVKGDPTRLNQIITNLCSNAVKFTEKGRITINVDKPADSHFIRFRVVDTGIGIPEDKLHLLFSNFKQVDSSTFRKYGGTGLGLSISKTLIELQGGKVAVKSKVGEGSEFTVSIPYEVGSEEDVKSLKAPIKVDYSSLSGIRVLVAEDNEYNQIVVSDTLDSLIKNVHIDIAENGLICLEMLQANDYDVILMDAQMPAMDGLDATRAIRKLDDSKKKGIPIIALTASVHKADIDKCLLVGMNGFVPKPFTRDELLGTMATFYKNDNSEAKSDKTEATQKKKGGKGSHESTGTENESNHLAKSVTDLTFLKNFTEGDDSRTKKYIGMYLKLLPGNMEKIEETMVSSDHLTMVKVLHAMRPHFTYMGMSDASEKAGDIEGLVRENENLNQIPALIKSVHTDCLTSQVELSEVLNEGQQK